MRKVFDLLKLGWVQFLLLVAALGGVPGIIVLWDRTHPVTQTAGPPPVSPAPAQPAEDKKTGSISKKTIAKPKRQFEPDALRDKYTRD